MKRLKNIFFSVYPYFYEKNRPKNMITNLKHTLIGCFLLLGLLGKATGLDTLPYSLFGENDSLYIHVNSHKQKYFLHTVDINQTAFSIATFYGQKLSDLKQMNPKKNLNSISIGDEIRVIISPNQLIRSKPKDFVEEDHLPVIYKVKRNETIFSIARIYFRANQHLLFKHNDLNENSIIQPGQPLIVGWIHKNGMHRPDGKYKPATFKENPALEKIANSNTRNRSLFYNQANKKKVYEYSGAATKSVKANGGLMILHRYAKQNSIVEIINPNTNITLYAKVVGKIPNTGYEDDIIAILPENLAEALGGKDRRFYVKTKYIK